MLTAIYENFHFLIYFVFCIFVFLFGGTGVQTQGFMLAKQQVLYHLKHSTSFSHL
jgi:hypothetical protein